MPLSHFELILAALRLSVMAQPTRKELADALALEVTTIQRRAVSAANLGLVERVPKFTGRGWFALTAFGESVFRDVLAGRRKLYFLAVSAVSSAEIAKPPKFSKVTYRKMKPPEYAAMCAELRDEHRRFSRTD